MDVILKQLPDDDCTEPGTYTLNAGPTLVGRSDNCTMVLASGSVSRWHCIIDVTSEGVFVTDLHSLNGTYVNEQRIIRRLLNTNDRLRIGSVSFLVQVDSVDQVLALPGAVQPPKALGFTDFSAIPALSPPRRRRPPEADHGPFEQLPQQSAPAGNSQMVRYEKALNDCSAQLRLLIKKVTALEAKLNAMSSQNANAGSEAALYPHKAFERHDALMYVARAAVCDKVRQKSLPSKSA